MKSLIVAALVIALMSGCGGGDHKGSSTAEASNALLAASTGSVENLRLQAKSFVPAKVMGASMSSQMITTDQLFDWAEKTFPELFPSQRSSQFIEPFTYRYYPENDLYLGVAGNEVFLLGAVLTEGMLIKVGDVGDFVEHVLNSGGDASIALIATTVLLVAQ